MKKKQTLRGVSKLGLTRRDKKNSCHDIPLSSTLGKKKKTKGLKRRKLLTNKGIKEMLTV
jgi:hypothetical protein